MHPLLAESKKTLALALPLIAALLAQKILQLISTLMMGMLSADALAAGALSNASYMLLLVIGMGILNAIGILIARHYGAGQLQAAARYLHHGFYVSLLLTLPCITTIWYLPTVFSRIGQDPAVVSLCQQYLHALIWGFPALLGFFTLREFVSALHHPRIVMVICALAIPFNAVLSYSLMTGFFGLITPLAMKGIGYANSATEWAMFLSLLYYVHRRPALRKTAELARWQRFNWVTIREVFHLGLPCSGNYFIEILMCSLVVVMMGYFGVVSLAAHQIAFQCASLAYMFPMGISMAMGIRVGHLIGAGEEDHLLRTLTVGLLLGASIGVIIITLLLGFPKLIINCFISPHQANYLPVQKMAITFLIMTSVLHVFDVFQGIFTGFLRGLRDTFVPMLISLVSYAVMGIGMGYLLAFQWHWQGLGLWTGIDLGLMVSSLLLGTRIYWHFQRKNRLYVKYV